MVLFAVERTTDLEWRMTSFRARETSHHGTGLIGRHANATTDLTARAPAFPFVRRASSAAFIVVSSAAPLTLLNAAFS